MSNTSLLGAYGALGNSSLLFRNKVINGDMRIHQRGGTLSSDGFIVDRFRAIASGATFTASQLALTDSDSVYPEFPYAARIAVSVGNDNARIEHRVEDVRTLAGQTVTFSFWAKGTNPGSGSFQVVLDQNFGSGGSATVATSDSLTVTASWKKYSITMQLPSIAGKTVGTDSMLQLYIRQPNGDTSTAAWTLDTTGWQLEAGTVATPFEHRPYSVELGMAQRYYFRTTNNPIGLAINSSAGYASFLKLPVTMRVAPALDTVVANSFTVSAGAAGSVGLRSGNGYGPSPDTVLFFNVSNNWTATADIAISVGLTAEL